MKRNSIIETTMHFLVHNSFMFTVAIMCLVHSVLLGITLYAGVTPLFYFNVLSVIVYLSCILLCKRGYILPVYISILAEVSIYSIVAVYLIGWNSGSYNFLFSIVPIIVYFGSYLFKWQKRWIIVMTLALIFILYSLLYIGHHEMTPVYEISDMVRSVMMIFSSFVMFFSVVFYSLIYIQLSELTMSNLEEKNEQLSVDAKEDSLTTLLNRRGFMPVIGALMQGVQSKHFCIAFCDIDNFKRINDSYGHDCGDEVLKHIAAIIKKEMTGCDVCRWGGEEIIILMRDYDIAVARKKMEYLRELIESTPTIFYNKRIDATITIGLEEYSDRYCNPEEIIKVADERMYYGKQHGKNVLIYKDNQES